jgi:hypothetical protein
MNIN